MRVQGGGGDDCGCGDGGAGCGTGYDTTGVLSYVGAGGDYRQETNYRYVGQGAGDFEMVAVPTNFRTNIWVCIIPLLMLLLLPLLLYLLPQLSSEPVTTLPPIPVPTPPPTPASTTSPCPYDCNQGYNEWPMQWVKGWSGAKKLYCCKTAQRGCPSELPPPSGLPPSGIPGEVDTGPYDCNAGYHPCYHCLVHQWSPMKLKWCCEQKNKGCQSNTPA